MVDRGLLLLAARVERALSAMSDAELDRLGTEVLERMDPGCNVGRFWVAVAPALLSERARRQQEVAELENLLHGNVGGIVAE